MVSPDDMYLIGGDKTECYKFTLEGIDMYVEKEIAESQTEIEFLIPDRGYFEIKVSKETNIS